MKKEILNEIVSLYKLFEGRYVKYVEQYYVEGCFVIFNNEGNKRFAKLKRLIEEYINKTIEDVILKDEILIASENSFHISCILNNDDKVIKRNSEGFWMIHQVFIDYAYSLILYNQPKELGKALDIIEEMQKYHDQLDLLECANSYPESECAELLQILRNNQNSSVFKYLLQRHCPNLSVKQQFAGFYN